MYKYQEALNYISKFISQVRGRGNGKSITFIKLAENLFALQELIDNQADYMSYKDLKAEYENKISILEKALDKACELIDTKYDCPFEEYEYQFKDKRNCYICDNKSNECWKEYLLKESEKQEAKKCKWCGSEIKENHRGYCSELCREYGEEWEYKKQLAIESEKQ